MQVRIVTACESVLAYFKLGCDLLVMQLAKRTRTSAGSVHETCSIFCSGVLLASETLCIPCYRSECVVRHSDVQSMSPQSAKRDREPSQEVHKKETKELADHLTMCFMCWAYRTRVFSSWNLDDYACVSYSLLIALFTEPSIWPYPQTVNRVRIFPSCFSNTHFNVRRDQVIVTMNVNVTALSDMTTYSLVECYQSFGLTRCLCLIAWGTNQRVLPKRLYLLTGLHGVTPRRQYLS
jgi:hypothetical protein